MISRRKAIGLLTAGIMTPAVTRSLNLHQTSKPLKLHTVRAEIQRHFDTLQIPNREYGAYFTGPDRQTDLYASCDIAIARHIMGENLKKSLSKAQRQQWSGYINSFQSPEDGSYSERYHHTQLHANGMTIGALSVLGERQKYQVKLYDAFDTPDKVVPWLEQINWAKQWGASHLFWGGVHCYSLSSGCTQNWLNTVFDWLNKNLDKDTGWWRAGTVYADRHQPLGGSVHILPIYQHHHRQFPYPEKVIDSVLALQLPNGRWLNREKDRTQVMHYLELDALYAFKYMMELAPGYRTGDIYDALHRYARLVLQYWNDPDHAWKNLHPHRILSIVGTFGLLQNLLPKQFVDDRTWTDIFSDIRLYHAKAVEAKS
ncbi:MAG: hypothetical protein HC819_23665 [Cyclobacteriaceae bacterium]|nr:hypothetical protein [Cyclobacteriaceae bacterium]